MPILEIYFDNTLNCSIQIGDTAFVSTIDSNGIASTTSNVGEILNITGDIITVDVTAGVTVSAGDYFSFAKPIEVNESGLKGYYADVTFENQSKKYAELFAISSEAVPSSK